MKRIIPWPLKLGACWLDTVLAFVLFSFESYSTMWWIENKRSLKRMALVGGVILLKKV